MYAVLIMIHVFLVRHAAGNTALNVHITKSINVENVRSLPTRGANDMCLYECFSIELTNLTGSINPSHCGGMAPSYYIVNNNTLRFIAACPSYPQTSFWDVLFSLIPILGWAFFLTMIISIVYFVFIKKEGANEK